MNKEEKQETCGIPRTFGRCMEIISSKTYKLLNVRNDHPKPLRKPHPQCVQSIPSPEEVTSNSWLVSNRFANCFDTDYKCMQLTTNYYLSECLQSGHRKKKALKKKQGMSFIHDRTATCTCWFADM